MRVYDREYFGSRRYENPICGAEGHNLIFIDGRSQSPGVEYRGRIIEHHHGDGWERIKIDVTEAYQPQILKRALRTLIFLRYNGLILIDEIECREGVQVES